MSLLTDEEFSSLSITNMILHVVGEEDFIPEPARQVEHAEFFIERIRQTNTSPVYMFDAASHTKRQIECIADGSDSFEKGAQALSREFSRSHVATSREGAFFVFELAAANSQTKIYSLIKYDYREAIEQSETETGSLLRRIVHAFIADQKAIQKSALIKVVNGVAEPEVSARDRVRQAPEIGDYFAAFLHVARSRDDVELNRAVVEVLSDIFKSIKEDLPGRDVAQAFRHAKGILRDRQQISEDAITEAILAAAGNPQDEKSRTAIQHRARRKIRSAKLDGLEFKPDPQVLRRPAMRRVKTTEGVTVVYPDHVEGATVQREPRHDGGETITIRTAQVTEDDIVKASPRTTD